MNKPRLLTKTGGLWHFHTIGTGIIISYSTFSNKIRLINESTGNIIYCIPIEFKTINSFETFVKKHYLKMLENPVPSLNMSYYDEPTYLGDAKVEVDFKLLLN